MEKLAPSLSRLPTLDGDGDAADGRVGAVDVVVVASIERLFLLLLLCLFLPRE